MARYVHHFYRSGTTLQRGITRIKPNESYEEAVARVLKDNHRSATPTTYVRQPFASLEEVQAEFVLVYLEPYNSESPGEEWNRKMALEALAEEMVELKNGLKRG